MDYIITVNLGLEGAEDGIKEKRRYLRPHWANEIISRNYGKLSCRNHLNVEQVWIDEMCKM